MALLCRFRPLLQHRVAIMSSARQLSEQVVEEMKEKNPYFEKYADKIAALQKTSPEEFLSRLDRAKKEQQKPKFGGVPDRDYSELLNPKTGGQPEQVGAEKRLSDIMKVELVADKTLDEIRHIWLEYHKTKEAVTAVISREQFEALQTRGREFPVFLFPLPRSEGFEFIMLQFAGNEVHFTPLIAYQVHKENAPECLTIVHYPELAAEKGVVLMRGDYDSKVINAQEAQCLANQLQLYYVQPSETKLRLLETFTRRPDEFKHGDVIREMENLKIE